VLHAQRNKKAERADEIRAQFVPRRLQPNSFWRAYLQKVYKHNIQSNRELQLAVCHSVKFERERAARIEKFAPNRTKPGVQFSH
jgi:uncharacterized protein YdeI (YjbR/CyaY-like superfamily)